MKVDDARARWARWLAIAVSVLALLWACAVLPPQVLGYDRGLIGLAGLGGALLFGAFAVVSVVLIAVGLLDGKRTVPVAELVMGLASVFAVAVFFLSVVGLPFRIGFDLSRRPLDALGVSALEGKHITTPVTAGLVAISRVTTQPGEATFGLSHNGNSLIYSPHGSPDPSDERITPLGGPWWLLTDVQ